MVWTRLILAALMIGTMALSAHAQDDQAADPDPVQVVQLEGNGVGVGVDVTQAASAPTWIGRNWGKLLVSIGTAAAVDRVAYNNDWLWYQGNSDSASRASSPSEATQTDNSQNIQINVESSQNVTVHIGDSIKGE